MSIERAIASPTKCHIVNLANGEDVACLFNPPALSEKVQVNWNRLDVPGLSHQVLQYQSTGNRALHGIEFYLDRFYAQKQNAPDILAFRTFLLALTVPAVDVPGSVSSAPPRARFIWQGLLDMEAVLTSVEFRYQQFGTDGSVLVYTATCDLEEINDVRFFSVSGAGRM